MSPEATPPVVVEAAGAARTGQRKKRNAAESYFDNAACSTGPQLDQSVARSDKTAERRKTRRAANLFSAGTRSHIWNQRHRHDGFRFWPRRSSVGGGYSA